MSINAPPSSYSLGLDRAALYSGQPGFKSLIVQDRKTIPTQIKAAENSNTAYAKFRLRHHLADWSDISKQSKAVLLEYQAVAPTEALRAYAISAIYRHVEQEGQWESYSEFVTQFQDAPERSKAEEQLMAIAADRDRIDDYQRFLAHRPVLAVQKTFLDKAAARYAAQGSLLQMNEFLSGIQTYAAELRNAAHERVMLAREPLLYEQAKSADSVSEYLAYLRDYPNSARVHIVRERIDELRFDQARSEDTIQGYQRYLGQAESDGRKRQARDRIAELERLALERKARMEAEEAARRAQREEERRNRELALQRAYQVEKDIGDRVCKDGSQFWGLINFTAIAFVEQKRGDRVQLRIFNAGGESIQYQGGTLRQNAVIWDDQHSWRLCN